MESRFEINGKIFKVDFSIFGHEKYFFDGNLLLKRWSLKFKDRLRFDCDGDKVEIDVSLSTKKLVNARARKWCGCKRRVISRIEE